MAFSYQKLCQTWECAFKILAFYPAVKKAIQNNKYTWLLAIIKELKPYEKLENNESHMNEAWGRKLARLC